MKKIGIICKKDRPEPGEILKALVPWLRERGAEVFLEKDRAGALGMQGFEPEELPSLVEMVVVLGGDGTMLGAARLVSKKGIPLLGINLGGLGFITEVHKEELYDAMESILNDECPSEERMMLTAQLTRDGEKSGEFTALNDVVIDKGPIARIIDLETSVNGAYVTHFRADGVIVSTPTGSTAYSLSAGGPILYPSLNSIVLTPICSHTLTNRPIVLAGDMEVEVALKSRSDGVLLTHDGLVASTLGRGDVVAIKKSPYSTRLLMPCGRDHFKVLRSKLKWGER
jgi:NAD+ kinase